VVLEKDGENQLHQSCEKLRRITYRQGGKEYPYLLHGAESFLRR